MPNTRFAALLRGINVGGSNIIKMSALRAEFEAMGFFDVATLIASGNVVFSASGSNKTKLVGTIETGLSDAFRYASKVVLVSSKELERVVSQAPKGFGAQPDRYRYDVLFVKEPMTTSEAFEQCSVKPGVDEAHGGDHALYFRRLISKATQSHLAKIMQRPVYKSLTIRNWNTTTKLLAMVKA